MKAIASLLNSVVAVALMLVSINTFVDCGVLPTISFGKNDTSKFEELSKFSSSLWGPKSYVSKGSGISRHVLQQSIESISKGWKEFVREFQHTKSPTGIHRLLDDFFEGISNDDCKGHILEWMLRIGGSDEEVNLLSDEDKWVLQMVDSWGKLPEGILSGHVNALGDFDECIQIKVQDLNRLNPQFPDISQEFEGRYCTAYLVDYNTSMMAAGRLSPPSENQEGRSFIMKTGAEPGLRKAASGEGLGSLLYTPVGMSVLMPSIALCMPNSCSQSDIHAFFTNALFNVYASIPEVDPEYMIYPLVATCGEKEKPDYSAGDIAMIVILSAFAGVSLFAGILDYWQRHQKDYNGQGKGTVYKYLMAFSVYTNTKKWLSTRKSAEDLGCLHGLRFFSTCWVVLCHSYAVFGMVPQWNMIDIRNLYDAWTIMPILNGTFSVDTFFVMSGMLATYNILKMLDKTQGKFNVFMFYVHRYIRLTPTYAILVGIMATLVVYMGNGPSWMVIEMQAKMCRDNWWTNILYINNIVNHKEMCNGESWYLANDFQFYILSPLMVYPLWKWPKLGLGLLGLYTIASCISPVLIVRYAGAPPAALMLNVMIGDGFYEIYFRPWARIQTFLVGVWLGWILYKTRGKRVNIPRIAVAGLWISSTILALLVIYGIRDWFDPSYEIPKALGYLYAALSRFSWGLVVAWVIFACIKGYGGIVNSFLSWKVFMPLGRLTFCVYLTSMHLQMIFHSRLSVPLKYDTYTMVNLFLAHMAMSLMVGFLCTVLFESPFIILHKLIFDGGSTKPQTQVKKVNDGRGEGIKEPTKRYGIFYEKGDTVINTQGAMNENFNEKEAKD